MPKVDTDAIKAANPIESTIERLSGQTIMRHKIRCPFHDDGSPSLHVYEDGGWKCFGCGLSGDVLSFVGYFFFGTQYDPTLHFIDVIDKLGALEIAPLPPRTTKPKPERPKLKISLEQITQWHETMPPVRWEYWASRGLNVQTISEFMLGWDGRRYTIPALYRYIPFMVKRRITVEEWSSKLALHGAFVAQSRLDHPEWADETNNKIYKFMVDAIREANPHLSEYQVFDLAPPKPEKYLSVAGSSVGIFNSDTLLDADRVVICEGEIDAMLLHQHGIRAVSSTGGAESWKDAWAKFFTHVENIYILYDNDDVGRKGGRLVQASLRRAQLLTLPDGVKDVGELFEKAGDPVGWLRTKVGNFAG